MHDTIIKANGKKLKLDDIQINSIEDLNRFSEYEDWLSNEPYQAVVGNSVRCTDPAFSVTFNPIKADLKAEDEGHTTLQYCKKLKKIVV